MTDDLKHYIESLNWPDAPQRLRTRLLQEAACGNDNDLALPLLLARPVSPIVGIAMAFSLVLCLLAGVLLGPSLTAGHRAAPGNHSGWPIAGANMLYFS